jgi:L-asparaginase II
MAFKVEDGSFRPRSAIAVEVLRQAGLLPPEAIDAFAARQLQQLTNVRGQAIGEVVAEFTLEPLHTGEGQR